MTTSGRTGSPARLVVAGRRVNTRGRFCSGMFVAVRHSLVTHCPSKFAAKGSR